MRTFTHPTFLVVRVLYSNPESRAHWEKHFTEVVRKIGGIPVPDHPSLFSSPSTGIVLAVYVDDLLLAGP